jgi:amino-acid N-acetyltransferase
MYTRKAVLPDAEDLRDLIADFSADGTLLPRSLAEICENIRDFTVIVEGDDQLKSAPLPCGQDSKARARAAC